MTYETQFSIQAACGRDVIINIEAEYYEGAEAHHENGLPTEAATGEEWQIGIMTIDGTEYPLNDDTAKAFEMYDYHTDTDHVTNGEQLKTMCIEYLIAERDCPNWDSLNNDDLPF
jgi:hypothetical protein